LPNDHFVHLTGAQQIAFGEWPTRDFVDPGLPFMYVASAIAQHALGHTLLAEVILVCLAFGGAAALTVMAAFDLTNSLLLSALAVATEVLIFPRTYGYPKILLYAAAFTAFFRYTQRQSVRRLVLLSVVTAVAFLFRHDHGLYIGFGATLAVWMAPAPNRLTRVGIYVAATAILILPYIMYLQHYGGLLTHFATAVAFSQREATREGHVWPSFFAEPTYACLVYVFHLLPFVATGVLVGHRRRTGSTVAPRILPLAAVAVVINFGFIRDPLNTRIPDAIVPASLLGVWLLSEAGRSSAAWLWRPLSGAIAMATAFAILSVGNAEEQISRLGLDRPLALPSRFENATRELRERFHEGLMPTDAATALVPFFRYLDRCTTFEDHLLIGSFLPEVPYYAQRPFAGGQSSFVEGYFVSETSQEQYVTRLSRQSVPFAIFTPEDFAAFGTDYPTIARYVGTRFTHLADIESGNTGGLILLIDRAASGPTDSVTGWPCVHPIGDTVVVPHAWTQGRSLKAEP
jgi:hypothetical protein